MDWQAAHALHELSALLPLNLLQHENLLIAWECKGVVLNLPASTLPQWTKSKLMVLCLSTVDLHLTLTVVLVTRLPIADRHNQHKSRVLQCADRTHFSEWVNGVGIVVPIVLFATLDIVAFVAACSVTLMLNPSGVLHES